jgi:hypothetical protein
MPVVETTGVCLFLIKEKNPAKTLALNPSQQKRARKA